jgi:hypothetical protein
VTESARWASMISEPNCSTPAHPAKRNAFRTRTARLSSNSLNSRASDIRTKTGVVRLRQRKGPEKDRKSPKMGLGPPSPWFGQMSRKAGILRGSGRAERNAKTVTNDETGGGRGTVVKPSLLLFQWVIRDTIAAEVARRILDLFWRFPIATTAGGRCAACKAAFDPALEQGRNTNAVMRCGPQLAFLRSVSLRHSMPACGQAEAGAGTSTSILSSRMAREAQDSLRVALESPSWKVLLS